MKHLARKMSTAVATVAALGLIGAGTAQADSLTGWVGPAGSNGSGVLFLNTSTIINAPDLKAESKIYSAFGQTVPSAEIGVRARLFSSGALCEATTYRYNTGPAAQFTHKTTNTCGAGWYNSHGYTAIWDGTSAYKEALTLPTNPLWWEPAAARSASPAPELTPESIPTGTNSAGETYGSGASAATDADLPDLVAAIGDDGTTVGFVRSADLAETPAVNPAEASKQSSTERTIPLFDEDGQTQVGTFTLT
ncbi:hypothetical protein BKP42_67640 [Rhodococcus erythropolis]|uniref:hypothetical protein n=1 Tax=Rhodococcus erythropolis TaxID=1833 RepID=UPI00117A4C32|nr:hypothetical protein [Rhodococcus erythropolis]PBI83777.1 hypothetical protein BKP42_67640 [Rhodococcus erythropolis]